MTMPHKKAIVEHLDSLDGDAAATGAVNTVQRTGDELVGHNTDVVGFSEFLVRGRRLRTRWARAALVLGAGGAARAVVKALADLKAASITVAARSEGARERGGRRLHAMARTEQRKLLPGKKMADLIAEVDLVVNATPIGMQGEPLLADVDVQLRSVRGGPHLRSAHDASHRTGPGDRCDGMGRAGDAGAPGGRLVRHLDRPAGASGCHVGSSDSGHRPPSLGDPPALFNFRGCGCSVTSTRAVFMPIS